MSAELEQKLIRAEARAAIAEAGASKSMKMLLPLVESRIAVIGGEVLPLDKTGEPTVGGVQRIVDELRSDEETAGAFRTAEPEQERPLERSRMTVAQKVAYQAEHGAEAYDRLPWKAEDKNAGPASWPVSKKVAYIDEHGGEAYQKLLTDSLR